MATVINNPDTRSDSSAGLVIGAIILVLAVVLLLAYGVPAFRGANRGTNINVPDKVQVDVNANTPGAGGTNQTNP
ncbi:MAG TPA: hypothetical protein VEA59_06445 [Patescibacteria group bacterium]|nr:hypothetical protein [Patescibacteria group bacterium]